jgi:gamma-glutamylcyclotransferase (GGCT)/AIG2-like uncharacterized protein YtfP
MTARAATSSPTRLFVYGSLAPGRPNEHVLADLTGTWEPATATGRLVHQGWGAALGYPALVTDPDAGTGATELVSGMLLTCAALDERWDRLDEFEGRRLRPGFDDRDHGQ